MMRTILIVLLAMVVVPAQAFERRNSGRLDAIAADRLYDRILTPQMNPDFSFDTQARADFLDDVRKGRFDLDRVSEAQRHYFQMQLDLGQ